jgi:hypothetical protein
VHHPSGSLTGDICWYNIKYTKSFNDYFALKRTPSTSTNSHCSAVWFAAPVSSLGYGYEEGQDCRSWRTRVHTLQAARLQQLQSPALFIDQIPWFRHL